MALPASARSQVSDTSYAIETGSYAGTVVPIRQSFALRRGSKFWRVAPRTDGRLVGWNPSSLPVGVAFKPGHGITAEDSMAFWSIVRAMEQDLGLHVFEPAMVSADGDPDDLIVVDTRSMSPDGLTSFTWSNNGAVYDARVLLKSRATMHDAGVVQHEMMHALGFGHTSAWPSIMNADGDGRRLTADDVAYAQAAIKSRAESERIDMWDRIALAVERSTPASQPSRSSGTCDSFSSIATGRVDPTRLGELPGMALVGVVTGCPVRAPSR